MRPQALLLVTLLTTIAFSPSLKSQVNGTPEFEPLFRIVKDGKWGLINKTGRVVIAPRFDELGRRSANMFGAPQKIWQALTLLESSPTSDEPVGVRLGKQWGFVNRDDGMSVSASFDGVIGSLRRGNARGRSRQAQSVRHLPAAG